LPTTKLKILFLLFYLKEYQIFDILGGIFGLARSKVHDNIYKIIPIPYRTLERMGVVPHRNFDDVGGVSNLDTAPYPDLTHHQAASWL